MEVVAADTAERVAKLWLIPQDMAAASCHHPLAAAGDNPGQGGTHAVQELCHSLD